MYGRNILEGAAETLVDKRRLEIEEQNPGMEGMGGGRSSHVYIDRGKK